jgi:uncharacterized protein (DUF362 family)
MARQHDVDGRSRLVAQAIHASEVEQSVWHSYASLMGQPNPKLIGRQLQGYDLSKQALEILFEQWLAASADNYVSDAAFVSCPKYDKRLIYDSLGNLLRGTQFETVLQAADNLFIKVGLIEAVAWSRQVTVAPAFLDALLMLLRDLRPGIRLLVGDGSGHERDTDYLLHSNGISSVLKRHPDVLFVDLNMDDIVPVNVPYPATLRQLLLPKSLMQADAVISLAKLKTHKWTHVSLGMKNIFGAIPGSIYGFPKNRLHWASYPRAISDIWSSIQPELVLIDGIIGVEGDGPLDGQPKRTGFIVAGHDPVAADGLATRIMGMSPHLIPTFWHATMKNLGELGPIQLDEQLSEVAQSYSPPTNATWLFRSAFKRPEEIFSLATSLLVNQPV